MKYLPLLDFQVTHTYYSDGRCPDFDIVPTSQTQRVVKNHRCVIRPIPNGVRVLASVDDDGIPFIALSDDAVFEFRLYLRNSEFALFTDLSDHISVAAPIYTNAGLGPDESVRLALTSRESMHSERLVVQNPSAAEPFTLAGTPSKAIDRSNMIVEGLAGISNVSSYDPAGKIVTVDTSGAFKGDSFRVSYETVPKMGRGVFADVEIHYNESLPNVASGPGNFELAFTAKQAYWNYYVVTDRAENEFNIEDGGESPIVFSSANRRDLGQEPDASDDVANSLADQYPEMRRIRFVSDDSIACSQQARKSIYLKMNGDSVGGVLPNPSPKNHSTVEVARNGETRKEDSLFQIVKFLVT